LIVYTEGKKNIKEKKPDIAFKTAEEFRDYLKNMEIFFFVSVAGEFQCWMGRIGAKYDFQWGGSTMLFTTGGYGVRINNDSIKSIEKPDKRNIVFVTTKKGGVIQIGCRPK
jgi:hypothetical protein